MPIIMSLDLEGHYHIWFSMVDRECVHMNNNQLRSKSTNSVTEEGSFYGCRCQNQLSTTHWLGYELDRGY